MKKLKRSLLIFSVCICMLISSVFPSFGYSSTVLSDSSSSSEALMPAPTDDTITGVESCFGYDCKISFSSSAEQWLSAVTCVTVNGVSYKEATSSYGVWMNDCYYPSAMSDYYLLVGEANFKKDINIIAVTVDGYEDFIIEVKKDISSYNIHEHSGGTATCTSRAVCAGCEKEYGELAAHKEAQGPYFPATCTVPGLERSTYCSVCKEIIVPAEVIPALGHTEVIDEAVEATCTETGLTGGSHCKYCGEVIVAQEVVPALGHKISLVGVKEATATEAGYTGDEVCEVCGEVVAKGEIIAATGVVDEECNCFCHGDNILSRVVRLVNTILSIVTMHRVACCDDMEYFLDVKHIK